MMGVLHSCSVRAIFEVGLGGTGQPASRGLVQVCSKFNRLLRELQVEDSWPRNHTVRVVIALSPDTITDHLFPADGEP